MHVHCGIFGSVLTMPADCLAQNVEAWVDVRDAGGAAMEVKETPVRDPRADSGLLLH